MTHHINPSPPFPIYDTSQQAVNIRLHSKRIYTISLVAALAGAGGLIAAFTFPVAAAPRFHAGLWVALALQLAGLGVSVLLMGVFWRTNRKARWRPAVAAPTPTSASPPQADSGQLDPAVPATASTSTSTAMPSSAARQTSRNRRPRTIEGLEGFTYTL